MINENKWEKQLDFLTQDPFASPSYFFLKVKIISEGNLSREKNLLTKNGTFFIRKGSDATVQENVAIPEQCGVKNGP
jgi:hypothetical protein